MSYTPYPKSEESGVAWIGRKPSHWQVMKLHHIPQRPQARVRYNLRPLHS
jgi:hypothetical protein